jgi:hypothetical protein
VVPALAGLVLGGLAIGPGLGPGFVLSYDMVFVPDPPFTRATFGLTGTLPRAVPSDAVVDVLSRAAPAEIVQKLILIAIFVLACSGAAAVLRDRPLLARCAAGVLFGWNPFVAERLLIGQWALLLGYSGLPWLVVAFREQRYRRLLVRLGCALVPAAVGGFSAMLISVLVIVPLAVARTWSRAGRPARSRALTFVAGLAGLAGTLALLAVLSLPWLVPSLLRQVQTDPAGVGAFAARADTPFGSLGSLLALGGIWNAQVVPPGYGGAATVFPLLLALTGMVGFALGCRRERLGNFHPDVAVGPGTSRRLARVLPADEECSSWRGLGAAAVTGLAVASIGLTPTGRAVLRSLIAAWPGFAVLRDGQQFIAPLALADAIGLGAAVSWAMRPGKGAANRARALPLPGAAAAALGIFGLLAPVLLLPGLAWGAGGRLTAVRYPASWLAVRQAIDTDRAAGSVLILPWGAYRGYAWDDGRTVLDPWPRLLRRQAIWNDGVQVGNLQLAPEDPEARRLSPLIRSGLPLTGPLRDAGVRYVIIDTGLAQGRGGPGGARGRVPGPGSAASASGAAADVPELKARLRGAEQVRAGPGLVVYRLPLGRANARRGLGTGPARRR